MSLRILIGHSQPGQRGEPTVLYTGPSSAALEAVRAANTSAASFSIINQPLSIRKTNPNYQPPAPEPVPEPAAEVAAGTGTGTEDPAPPATPPKSKK
jgi:hypothetical protein